MPYAKPLPQAQGIFKPLRSFHVKKNGRSAQCSWQYRKVFIVILYTRTWHAQSIMPLMFNRNCPWQHSGSAISAQRQTKYFTAINKTKAIFYDTLPCWLVLCGNYSFYTRQKTPLLTSFIKSGCLNLVTWYGVDILRYAFIFYIQGYYQKT